MYNNERPLDNPINWSFRIGRIWGITIRVHVVFVICAVILIASELPKGDDPSAPSIPRALLNGLGTYVILFGIVLLHEFGHCWGARREGGSADEILLWPLGGLAYTHPPHHWRAHLVTTVAGPAVNVLICTITSAALALWCGSLLAVPLNPLHPFRPIGDIFFTEGQFWLSVVHGVSYFLLLVNLLPIFPFDGGRIMQALIWRTRGFRTSMEIATGTGMVGAILVGLFALFSGEADWILLSIAIFGYMTCWQTRRWVRESGGMAVEGFGGDLLGGGYVFREEVESKPGPIARWRARRAAVRQGQKEEARRAHEYAVEDILRKVSQSGLASLSASERLTLERETQRQRSGPS